MRSRGHCDMNFKKRDSDAPLTPEEFESLIWIARLGRRQDVPQEHFETLLQAGYITKTLISPITQCGLRRLATGLIRSGDQVHLPERAAIQT